MLSRAIQYQIKKTSKVAFLGLLAIALFIFLLSNLFYFIIGESSSSTVISLDTWSSILFVAVGVSESVKFFRSSNLLGLTRTQQFIGYLVHIIFISIVLAVIFMIASVYFPTIDLHFIKLTFPEAESTAPLDLLSSLLNLFSLFYVSQILGACFGLFVNKFNRRIGIWVVAALAMFGPSLISLIGGAAFTLLTGNANSFVYQFIMQMIDLFEKVPKEVYEIASVFVITLIYWLLHFRHVSKSQ